MCGLASLGSNRRSQRAPGGLVIRIVARQLALGLELLVLLADERIAILSIDRELHDPHEVVEAHRLDGAAPGIDVDELRQVLLAARDAVAQPEDLAVDLAVDRPDNRGHRVAVVRNVAFGTGGRYRGRCPP